MITLINLENDRASADSRTRVIMSSLLVNCSLDHLAIVVELLYFDANGVAAF